MLICWPYTQSPVPQVLDENIEFPMQCRDELLGELKAEREARTAERRKLTAAGCIQRHYRCPLAVRMHAAGMTVRW